MTAVSQPSAVSPGSVSRSGIPRFEWLDALRGVAALAVMVYHAREILWVGLGDLWRKYGTQPDLDALIGYLTAPFSFGYLGVTLFFVVSGFSIHFRAARKLAAEGEDAQLPLQPFFLRRLLRLYPTYCAALAVTACIDLYLVDHLSGVVGADDHRLSAFVATLFGLQGFVSPHFGSASVFWTLVLEMHLYLVYPFLFHLSRRRGPEFVLFVTFVVSVATITFLRILNIPERWPYWHAGGPVFLKYWFTWSVGFYIAELVVGRARLNRLFTFPMGISAIGIAIFLTSLKLFDVAELPFAVAFGCFLLACARRRQPARTGIFVRSAALIGVMSYSLYCIHVPVLRLTRIFINSGAPSQSVLALAIGAVITIGAGALLYLLVEHWSISLSRATGNRAGFR